MTRHLGSKWNDATVETFADIIKSVGFQGVNQLLIGPHNEREELIRAYLEKKGLAWQEADEIVNYYYAYTMEAVELAALIGYSLALTPPGLGSLGKWLGDSLARADVVGYDTDAHSANWSIIAETIDKAVNPD